MSDGRVHITTDKVNVKYGLGGGSVIAVTMSFAANKSILWAIGHGICGWFYVIYRALGYGGSY